MSEVGYHLSRGIWWSDHAKEASIPLPHVLCVTAKLDPVTARRVEASWGSSNGTGPRGSMLRGHTRPPHRLPDSYVCVAPPPAATVAGVLTRPAGPFGGSVPKKG